MYYVYSILSLASSVIQVYSWLCFVRIVLTWIPGAQYSAAGRALAAICDPFLNIFRGIRWMQIGGLDFSPAVAIGLLYAVRSILSSIMRTGRLYVGGIIATIIGMFYSIVSSLITFLLLLLAIRFIAILFQRRGSYTSSFWAQMDYALEPLVDKLSSPFVRNPFQRPSYKARILLAIAILIALWFTLCIVVVGVRLRIGLRYMEIGGWLIHLALMLPF